MSTDARIETQSVAQMVEQYVDDELRDAAEYENSTPLDESGVYDLHTLAARIYAEGYNAGANAERERLTRERYRQRSA